jgi:hypothetical protein
MKKLLIGILALGSISAFATELKTTCGNVRVVQDGGAKLDEDQVTKLINYLQNKNEQAGYLDLVNVTSHMLSTSNLAAYCVISKK